MRNIATTGVLVGFVFLWTTGAALAQAKPAAKIDVGALEYGQSCALCHGLTAKGDSSYNVYLAHPAPDLTTLAKRNGGVFPFERVYEVIDGRQTAGAHGTRDMPIWGARYINDVNYSYPEISPEGAEASVRARILALVEYINRLQVK